MSDTTTTEKKTESAIPKVTPLDGITTIDDKMTFEPERLSYAAARKIAACIATSVKDAVKDRPVVIANDAFLADLGNLGAAKLQLEMLTEDYERTAAALTPVPAAAVAAETAKSSLETMIVPGLESVTAVAAGLQGALGLVSLLREDVELRGVVTRIDPRAFDIALASALRTKGVKPVYVPDLMVVRSPLKGTGSLQARLREMQGARQAAWKAAGPLLAQLGRKDAEMDSASRAGQADRVTKLAREVFELRSSVEPLVQTLTSADRRLNDLQTQWDKAGETTGLTMIARLLRAETLDAAKPRYLHAAVVASGGHNRVTRNLFRMIFTGDGLSSMGGVVVRWALLETDGSFEKGDIEAARASARFPSIVGDDDGWETAATRSVLPVDRSGR
jgi:hypothetical protein